MQENDAVPQPGAEKSDKLSNRCAGTISYHIGAFMNFSPSGSMVKIPRKVRPRRYSATVRAGHSIGGKEKPFCPHASEACWQQNRLGHFTLNM
jgi:hypothetical protein